MGLPLFIVDAFASRPFSGNPAAVVILDEFLGEPMLQAIAAENNLSETAFVVRRGPARWDIRWFTPTTEVPLCGHATLASAQVLFSRNEPVGDEIVFATARSGDLRVVKTADGVAMDFPATAFAPARDDLGGLLRLRPEAVLKSASYIMAVLSDARKVREFQPDPQAILTLDRSALIITAPGDGHYDCISRFFGPAIGVDEDPVTGAAHTMIAPYWAERLGRPSLRAFQASSRGGELECRVAGDRVILSGQAQLYMTGTIDDRCLERPL